jgi:serine/threonine protein kinase
MSLKLTAASFLAGVRQSGLIEPKRLDKLLDELQQSGVNLSESAAISAALVERHAITDWQSEKLLQGRHKGFLLGRYKLMSLLGTGEMSAVYLAEHVKMERRCAIKVLPANKVQDTSYLGRFHREARAVATLNHPNIVKAFDVDQQSEGGTEIHFLVMEFVEGKNLGALVAEQGPLEFAAAVDIIRQAADGLHHAHEHGLVHRDVKPENFLIDSDGHVKLLDLGLARFFQSSDEESLTIKHDEKVLGTADYLAPEQAVDSHKVDLRADVYSLGCTFYYALTGHPPFTDGSLVQRLLAHQTRKPPSVKYDRPDAPEELLAILDKMMAKRPAERYQSAAAVTEALSRWLIEHAAESWKQKHVNLVARYAGAAVIPEVAARPVADRTVPASTKPKPETDDSEIYVPPVEEPPVYRTASRLDRAAAPRSRTEPAAKAPRAATEPVRRAGQSPHRSGPVMQVARDHDWERPIAIALVSLATVLVVMIGVWLFGAKQSQAQSSTDSMAPVPAAIAAQSEIFSATEQ